ncbi:DUF6376 family protein [Bacillus solimangrovi]|uniref:Lipoprotein n=1 Tax=Bacillus solimangrovi TaxID=1305675 RepID=A0A1E5LG08_9BACI|nr:DUF6376 family protein [Bacillus solimangrovi]OEH93018.1 hypothetical protein BFG57_13765 [Bacillus solimangrovi]
MRKTVSLLLVLLLIVGCTNENVPTKDYFVGTEEYLHEINSFKKDIPELVQNSESDLSKINLIQDRVEKMKEEIEFFNSLVPPENLKRMHDVAITYNIYFTQSLEYSLEEMKKENLVSERAKILLIGRPITNVQNNLTNHIKLFILEEQIKDGE